MKENKIAISVLMPIFKPKIEELRMAVESIRKQTMSDWELLLLYESCKDDGHVMEFFSSIIREEKRIVLIELPEGYGLPKSLNVGIESAKGKYIARMDADDCSYPDRLEKQYRFMEAHPEVDVLGSAICLMGSKKIAFRDNYLGLDGRRVRMIFSNSGVAHPTAVIRKDFLNKHEIKYSESIKGSEDYALWADILLADGRIENLQEPLLYYRVSENQASKRLADEMIMWDADIKRKLLRQIGDFNNEEENVLVNYSMFDRYLKEENLCRLFEDIIEKNEIKKVFDNEILRKELAYEWMWRCCYRIKYYKDFGMLQKKPFRMSELLFALLRKMNG